MKNCLPYHQVSSGYATGATWTMTDAHSFTSLIVETAQPPEWTTGLERRGFFYEGYTDNLQETLNKHSAATVEFVDLTRVPHAKLIKKIKILRFEYNHASFYKYSYMVTQ